MIVEGKLWHLLYLVDKGLRPEDVAAIEAFTTYSPGESWVIESYRPIVAATTLLDDDGMPLAFSALYATSPGCLFSWTVAHYGIKRKIREWLPGMHRFFDRMFEAGFHRIECDVLEGFGGAERTIQHLGFEKEGVRRGLGKDRRNAIIYAKVKP